MNTTYELTLLLDASMSEDQIKDYVTSFSKEFIEPRGGNIDSQDFWGRKTLAYPINKDTTASYVVLYINMPGSAITKFDEEIRLEKKIIRHLLIKEEKNNVRMTLEEIKAWNVDNLPEKPQSSRPQEKRAVLKKRAPKRGPADNEIVPQKKAEDKKKQQKMDKELLNKELDAILDE